MVPSCAPRGVEVLVELLAGGVLDVHQNAVLGEVAQQPRLGQHGDVGRIAALDAGEHGGDLVAGRGELDRGAGLLLEHVEDLLEALLLGAAPRQPPPRLAAQVGEVASSGAFAAATTTVVVVTRRRPPGRARPGRPTLVSISS